MLNDITMKKLDRSQTDKSEMAILLKNRSLGDLKYKVSFILILLHDCPQERNVYNNVNKYVKCGIAHYKRCHYKIFGDTRGKILSLLC